MIIMIIIIIINNSNNDILLPSYWLVKTMPFIAFYSEMQLI